QKSIKIETRTGAPSDDTGETPVDRRYLLCRGRVAIGELPVPIPKVSRTHWPSVVTHRRTTD
ncbi:hypothetical protein HAX54_051182, partial [Datura stramonium]|nr:hypothetical protein [Datura stramonium]